MNVFLVELKTLEPVVVVSKKGKTRFVEGSRYIPASSIAGALARRAILKNVENDLGNCKKIDNPNKNPECSTCPEDCLYRKIWIEKNFKITNAVFGSWTLSSPGIPELQTACESRKAEKDSKKDQLLSLFIERMFWSNGIVLEKLEEARMRYKKKPSTFDGTDFKNAESIQLTRVMIDEKLRTSKEGMLYSFTAIKDGQKLRFAIFCDESIEELLEGEIKVGAWKSRGMGLVKLNILEKYSKEKFLEKRTKEMKSGFEKIRENFDGKISDYYGTYTYLTDGTQRPELEVVFKAERIRKFVRFERLNNIGHFIARNTFTAGSAGVFYARDPDELAKRLAEFELKILSQPWFDWVFFNHPVHYEKSILRG